MQNSQQTPKFNLIYIHFFKFIYNQRNIRSGIYTCVKYLAAVLISVPHVLSFPMPTILSIRKRNILINQF